MKGGWPTRSGHDLCPSSGQGGEWLVVEVWRCLYSGVDIGGARVLSRTLRFWRPRMQISWRSRLVAVMVSRVADSVAYLI